MKLSNLSLAIFVALGAVACGGSSSDNTNNNQTSDPVSSSAPTTTTVTPTVADALDESTVDPTKTHVVDEKDLLKQTTVGALQYIRRDDSQYDRVHNPDKPASASPLLGVALDVQNPRLTNIVLARQDLLRADGVPVKAQFTGSVRNDPLNEKGEPVYSVVDSENASRNLYSLQAENYANVDILADAFGEFGTNINNDGSKHVKDNKKVNEEGRTQTEANSTQIATLSNDSLQIYASAGKNNANVDVKSAFVDSVNPIAALYASEKSAATADHAAFYDYDKTDLPNPANSKADGRLVVTAADVTYDITNDVQLKTNVSRLGRGLVWWSTPATAFENNKTRKGAVASGDDVVKAAEKSYWATNGLIRIGGDQDTLGQETVFDKDSGKWVDHHNTTTRIFGRYHLAFRDQEDSVTRPMKYNTFTGARSFVSSISVPNAMIDSDPAGGVLSDANKEALLLTGKPLTYSIGAVPDTLYYVQYGRVTTNLDLELANGTFADGFQYAEPRRKNDTDGVDNYFYRGINATSIAEMAALPTDKKLVYQGHALMYGIDNSYHGGINNLPNAFAYGSDGLGLGNFVEATADLSKNELVGTVYNAWLLDSTKNAVTNDVLVDFSGKIYGNTVVGTADRRYLAGDDGATFKASFFGNAAEELGGAFNSVKDEDKYGSAYAQGDWGGVFGAKLGGSTNTFQGDDGANVYTGLSN